MKIKSTLSFLFLLPFTSMAQTQYTVRKGDTILKIADKNLGTTDNKDPRRYDFAKHIQKLNPGLKNLNQLKPGQTLIIPAKDKPVFVDIKKPAPVDEPPKLAKPEPPSRPVVVENPLAKEIPTEPVVHKVDEGHPNFVFIQARYQMLHLQAEEIATRTEASLKAKTSFGLDLQYGKIINEKVHLLFQGGITQTNFKSIEGDATSVNHTSETSKSFGVGIAYKAAHNLHLDFMILYADRTFLLPEGLGVYKLESVGIPGAELNISWDFYSGKANIFGVSAIAEYIGNYTKDEVDYKSALEPLGALYWKSNRGHNQVNYKTTLTYKQGHQKTNVSEQKEELAILGVGFYF